MSEEEITKPHRILITGARGPLSANQIDFVRRTILFHARRAGTLVTLVHGACIYGGVDDVAEGLAASENTWIQAEPHPAAGFNSPPARNTHMVRRGADECLGFAKPGSRGTWDCAKKAADAGIPTIVRSLPDATPAPSGEQQ